MAAFSQEQATPLHTLHSRRALIIAGCKARGRWVEAGGRVVKGNLGLLPEGAPLIRTNLKLIGVTCCLISVSDQRGTMHAYYLKYQYLSVMSGYVFA